MKPPANDFYLGFAAAVADLIRAFDQPSMAVDIMRRNGITPHVLRRAGAERFDMEPIWRAWDGKPTRKGRAA